MSEYREWIESELSMADLPEDIKKLTRELMDVFLKADHSGYSAKWSVWLFRREVEIALKDGKFRPKDVIQKELVDVDPIYRGMLADATAPLIELVREQPLEEIKERIDPFVRLTRHLPLSPLHSIDQAPEEWIDWWNKRCTQAVIDDAVPTGMFKFTDYYYKVDCKGEPYTDKECTKLVKAPFYPPTFPIRHPDCETQECCDPPEDALEIVS